MSVNTTADQLSATVSKLVDEAMQAAVSRSAYTAAWHNADYWFTVRDEVTAEIIVAVDLLRPASGPCSRCRPTSSGQ